MKDEDRLQALIARARDESPPRVDVAGRVIATLAAERDRLERLSDRPLMWLAAFSSAVAVPIVVLAIVVYNTWAGPLFEISQAIAWVTQ
ncbi:MAG: hypothetical protein AMJ75_07170 [Phycisphaerae bacterium SM1_79]|nr:MAG: hypothetical protein AMJ75_07170 [Phycisphaerae bacterium SM1_79]